MTREKININKKSIWHKEQVHKHTHDRLSDVWLAVYNIYPDCCSNVLLVPAYNPGAKKKSFLALRVGIWPFSTVTLTEGKQNGCAASQEKHLYN